MKRRFIRSRVGFSIVLALILTTAFLGSRPMPSVWPLVAAADTTPDCTGLDAYQQQLRTIRDEYRAEFLERLPGITPEWEITGGMDPELAALAESGANYELAWTNWLAQRSNVELREISKLWSERVSRLRELQPPLVAQDFHAELIAGATFLARFYEQSSQNGWMMAIFFTMLSGDDGSPSMAELNDALVASCPAWANYQSDIVATPAPN